jgi:hypothetical protein
MAQLLNLAKEDSSDDVVLREVKRRVWWSLYLIDRYVQYISSLPLQIYLITPGTCFMILSLAFGG